MVIMFNLLGTVLLLLSTAASNADNSSTPAVYTDKIPKDLPHGTLCVYIKVVAKDLTVAADDFTGSGWADVKVIDFTAPFDFGPTFYFQTGCFRSLIKLEELHIHGTIDFFYPFLRDLSDTVLILDFSNCTHLRNTDLFRYLINTNIAPSLEELYLRNIGAMTSDSSFNITEDFCKFIGDRPVKILDLSFIQIAKFNLNAAYNNCQDMVEIRLEGTTISAYDYDFIPAQKCPNLKTLFANRIILPAKDMGTCNVPITCVHQNITYLLIDGILSPVSSVTNLSMSGFCFNNLRPNLEDCHLYIMSNMKVNFKQLYLDDMFFTRLDIIVSLNGDFNFTNDRLELLSLRRSHIEYINPRFLQVLRGLRVLFLSDNNLGEMAAANTTEFEKLLREYPNLQTIDLEKNTIQSIPDKFFDKNYNLTNIVLSGNILNQITFDIKSLVHLEVLDLSKNNINILNKMSRAVIDARTSTGLSVILDGNPLSCSVCEDLDFVQWLLLDSTPVSNKQNLTCRNENNIYESVTKGTLERLRDMCEAPIKRRNLIILSSVTSTSSLVFAIVFVVMIYRCVHRRNERRRIEETEQLFQDGHGEYEFAVFLAFCSDDEHFVYDDVATQLDEALQNRLATQRELVCIGDKHFRFGNSIFDETVKCIRRSSLVVIVLSDAFLQSGYCVKEFQQAQHMGKRIIFFVKGQIDEAMLPPSMGVLYRTQVRVVWSTDDNGGFVMKTTWAKISDSIVELNADAL